MTKKNIFLCIDKSLECVIDQIIHRLISGGIRFQETHLTHMV